MKYIHYVLMVIALLSPGMFTIVSSAEAIDTPVSQSTVYTMSDSVTVDGAFSVLVRQEDEIAMMLHAEDLTPNDAITVWWVIFNNPQACSDPCNSDDFPQNGGDPAVNAAMIVADGAVVKSDGTASFTARLEAGDTSGAYAFETGGLQDVSGAEVHLVVRTHGQAIVELLDDQLTSLHGGCESDSTPGPNTCANIMASLHFGS